jgi:hypothetical protein
VPDAEYFEYGTPPCSEGQGAARIEYLPSMLEISDIGDAAILLLNPEIVTSSGEWEGWDFATWAVTPTRHRSFWEMMQALYVDFLQLRDQKRDGE